MSKFFTKSTSIRIIGALTGLLVFFIITNFGVWIAGGYEKNIFGLIMCYT